MQTNGDTNYKGLQRTIRPVARAELIFSCNPANSYARRSDNALGLKSILRKSDKQLQSPKLPRTAARHQHRLSYCCTYVSQTLSINGKKEPLWSVLKVARNQPY